MSGSPIDELDAQVRREIERYLDHNSSVEQLRQYIRGVMWRTLAEKPLQVLFVQQTERLLEEEHSRERVEASLRTALRKVLVHQSYG